jgi:hypothetical protein
MSWRLLAAGLLLGLCARAWGSPPGFDAQYRLYFNDQLVGSTFFRLRSTADSYAFEAFTVPEGQYRDREQEHEILEISEGAWDEGLPVPREYVYNLRDATGNHLFEQAFDWKDEKLQLRTDQKQQSAPLEAGTQDRLSYLLRLAQAVRNDVEKLEFAIAEPEQTVKMRFRALLNERLELPPGSAQAVGVECFVNGDTPERTVWIVPEWVYVPALIERAVPDGRVRMTLESFTRVEGGEAPEIRN